MPLNILLQGSLISKIHCQNLGKIHDFHQQVDCGVETKFYGKQGKLYKGWSNTKEDIYWRLQKFLEDILDATICFLCRCKIRSVIVYYGLQCSNKWSSLCLNVENFYGIEPSLNSTWMLVKNCFHQFERLFWYHLRDF